MKDNTSRDLMALSCTAYQRKDFDNAAKLFALAMSNPDAGEFIGHLFDGNYTGQVLAESLANSKPDSDLDSISSSMRKVMEGMETSRKRQALRSDAEDFDYLNSQSMDSDDEEDLEADSSTVQTVKSPLSIKLSK